MTKRKSISVWLILTDGRNKGKVALQRRSSEEKKFPYVFQATWAGKVEFDESTENATKRECEEELGGKFCKNFAFSELKFLKEGNFTEDKSDWTSFNYLGKMNNIDLKNAKIHKKAFPNFTFIGREDKFYSVESEKNPKNNVVLFNDQYDVIKKILR